ncbi:MAG: hypothetical protein AAGF46_07875 [Pseudomonadota bacterium]
MVPDYIDRYLWVLPIVFGVGFLGPFLTALLDQLGVQAIIGLPVLPVSMVIGGVWALVAVRRGSWI